MAGTSLLHQVRDQAVHVAAGLLGGFVVGFDIPWYWQLPIGIGVSGFYGALREIKQWGQLNSPSLKDSIIDASFIGLGGLLGVVLRHFFL